MTISTKFALIAVIFWLCTTYALGAGGCEEGRYRFETRTRSVEQANSAYCVEEDGIHLASRACRQDLKACVARIRKAAPAREPGMPEVNPAFGSPGFRNCRDFGGIPRFAEFKIRGEWRMIASCFFDELKAFLDNDTFYRLTRPIK